MRKKLGDNGRKLVENFSWDKIAMKTEQLYRDILEGDLSKINQK